MSECCCPRHNLLPIIKCLAGENFPACSSNVHGQSLVCACAAWSPRPFVMHRWSHARLLLQQTFHSLLSSAAEWHYKFAVLLAFLVKRSFLRFKSFRLINSMCQPGEKKKRSIKMAKDRKVTEKYIYENKNLHNSFPNEMIRKTRKCLMLR